MINQENFEAWLFAQPRERTFRYSEGDSNSRTGCILCNYLREQTNRKSFIVGGTTFDGGDIPEWLRSFLYFWGGSSRLTEENQTFGIAQDHYLTCFPQNFDGVAVKQATLPDPSV